jgi:hypothetical protein
MNNMHKNYSKCFYFKFTLSNLHCQIYTVKFTLSGLMQMHYMNPNNLLDFMNILTIDRSTMFFLYTLPITGNLFLFRSCIDEFPV